MALNTQLSNATVNAQAVTFSTLCNGGLIKIYNGTQPTTADTAITSQTCGVTFSFDAVAFNAPVNGLLTANAILPSTSVASITPTWARLLKSDSTTVITDISAGAADCNLTIDVFVSGAKIYLSSFTHDVSNSFLGV